jgi:YbbR domain-containing protein
MNLATWSSVAVVLDLTSVDKPGDRTYVLDGSTVNLPYGIELIRAVPSQVRLRFERSVTLDVPVQPQFENGPPTGYRIAEHSIAPERVRVVGPESRVSGVEYAVTDPIDLSSTFGSAEFRVAAGVDDELVRLDRQQMLRVRVRVEKIEGFHD